MELTKKQSEMFVSFYKNRYGDTKELPIITKGEEKKEIEIWKAFIAQILGSRANKLYKYRSWGKETVLEKVFNSLWLNYGPRVLVD